MLPVRYAIDADDRLHSFNDGWTIFAAANDGQALLPSLISGRPLWEFVTDSATRHLYRTMIDRVRAGAAPIRFQFRCDAPELRRLLAMELSAAPSSGVWFDVTAMSEERRPRVALLDPNVPRGDTLITICAWCKRVRVSEEIWVETEEALDALRLFDEAVLPGLTHGLCGACQTTILGV